MVIIFRFYAVVLPHIKYQFRYYIQLHAVHDSDTRSSIGNPPLRSVVAVILRSLSFMTVRVQCCFTSTETVRSIRDGLYDKKEPRFIEAFCREA